MVSRIFGLSSTIIIFMAEDNRTDDGNTITAGRHFSRGRALLKEEGRRKMEEGRWKKGPLVC
jgi:hypothetical protein